MGERKCISIGFFVTFCTLASAHAQTAACEIRLSEPQAISVNAGQKSQSAEQFANERLAVWQQRLKLEDWQISIVPARRSDLRPGTMGAIRWDKKKKAAMIWVLDTSDYQLPIREMLDDLELTIVHELIHLELASLSRSEASRSSEEHAVNRIAEALLKLDRQK